MITNSKAIYIGLTAFIYLLCGLLFSGCSQTDAESLQMPDIVFLEIRSFPEEIYDGGYQVSFCDSNGNYYSSDIYHDWISMKDFLELFAEGTLENEIPLHQSEITCGTKTLLRNYHKLLEVSKNTELDIVYPQDLPAAETVSAKWYGFYYDENQTLQSIMLHKLECTVDLETNDRQANQIYNWYKGTFHEKSEIKYYSYL